MSNSPMTEEDLQGYIDQRLSTARQTEVKAYLDAHPDLKAKVDGCISDREALRDAFAPIVNEPLPSDLDLQRIIERRRRFEFVSIRGLIAASVLLFVGGVGGWSLRSFDHPPSRGVEALAREAVASYAVYGAEPLNVAQVKFTDQQELEDLALRRLGYRVTVPDLSASGFRVISGSFVATSNGPALMFLLENDKGTRIAMVTRAMEVDRNAPLSRSNTTMAQHSRCETVSFTWADRGAGYSVVGSLQPAVLHGLADEVRKQEKGA
jgi:anti-sigma factor RsiW